MKGHVRHIISWNVALLILCLCATATLQAQHDKASKKAKSSIQKSQLDYARSIQNEQPTAAIKTIEGFIAAQIKNGSSAQLDQAFTLLGDINAENGLYAKAIENYTEAARYSTDKNDINLKIGKSYLQIDPRKAESYFNTCLSQDPDNTACREGQADVLLRTERAALSIPILKQLEQLYIGNDPIAAGRIQAKLALAYAAEKNISAAYSNYSNALQNIPPSVKDENRSVLKKASDSIAVRQSPAENYKLRRTNIDYYSEDGTGENESDIALEQLELVDAYVASGATADADKEIQQLKGSIATIKDPEVKATIYKKESDLLAYRGDYESAVLSFQQYAALQDSVYTYRLQEINRTIELQNAQNSADLNISTSKFERDKQGYEEQLVDKRQWIIYLLSTLLAGSLIGGIILYRSDQKRKRSNKLLELRSLRSEMNPHFIFNALGNVNEYIAASDERRANRFLSDFSKLMRNVLEHNQQDLIPLHKELELSTLYLKLEHARWRDQFQYTVEIDDNISDLHVPPLILQPYLENAVWHGLRYREQGGQLHFKVQSRDSHVVVTIKDNGIGRQQSAALKTAHQKAQKSTGIQNTKRRAALLDELYRQKIQVDIQNSTDDTSYPGTTVRIKFPKE